LTAHVSVIEDSLRFGEDVQCSLVELEMRDAGGYRAKVFFVQFFYLCELREK
jgi:hypothetical protein